MIAAGVAATHLEKAAGIWEQASKDQASATSQTMSNVGAAAKQLSGFILRTDNSVNSQLLPALSNSITEQNAALLSTQQDLQEELSRMGRATQQAQAVLTHADQIITDPALKSSLDSVAEAGKNAAIATDQAAKTMTDVRAAVDYEVHELTKPVSKIKLAALFVLKALGVFFGY